MYTDFHQENSWHEKIVECIPISYMFETLPCGYGSALADQLMKTTVYSNATFLLFFPKLDIMPLPPSPALAVKVLDSWITPVTVNYVRASGSSLPSE